MQAGLQILDTLCAEHGITSGQYNVLRILRGAHPEGYALLAVMGITRLHRTEQGKAIVAILIALPYVGWLANLLVVLLGLGASTSVAGSGSLRAYASSSFFSSAADIFSPMASRVSVTRIRSGLGGMAAAAIIGLKSTPNSG